MGFGFENPAWLAGVGLLAPLVWLYLRVRPRPPATVSSLRIWRLVPSPTTPARSRPKLPPLFFVQAALILASSLALAGPYRREPRPPGPPRDAVVVLDVSASMQTRSGSSTRFDEALAEAKRRVDQLASEGRRITILRAGPQPEVVATGLGGPEAREALDRLQALDTPANLTAAIELAATLAGADGSIDLFSDVDASGIVMSEDARSATAIHAFREGGDNVAVSDVRVQTGRYEKDASSRLLVTVRNFSSTPREVDLEIVPLDATVAEPASGDSTTANSDSPRADDAEADAGEDAEAETGLVRHLELEPRAQSTVAFDGIRWGGVFEARIAANDDLPLDDVVYGWVPPARTVDVLLVTDDSELAKRMRWLAERAGTFTIRSVGTRAYDPHDVGEITLFDRFVPKLPPTSNVAYLAPPRGNADVTVPDQPKNVKVAERREHPLLRGIASTSRLVGEKPIGLGPGPLRPLLVGRSEGREIDLIQAGEVGGREIVATGFRIDPKALSRPDDLPSLVFVLNLLSFLSPEAKGAPLLRTTGERVRAGSRLAAPIDELRGPGGTHTLAPGSDLTLDRAGVYEATSQSGTRPVYVSFVDAGESDVRRESGSGETDVVAPPVERSAVEELPGWTEIPYLQEILFVLAALLVAEWLLVAATAPGARPRASRES